MLAHCTAAALVSENKTLCHPASVDSLSTSAGTEDHVSMGGFAARKCLQVVRNVEKLVAIELLAACQAIEFLRPLKTTQPLQYCSTGGGYQGGEERSRPLDKDKDRYMSLDIAAAGKLLKEGKIWQAARHHMESYHSNQSVETRVFSPSTFTSSGELPAPGLPRKRKNSLQADAKTAKARNPPNGL